MKLSILAAFLTSFSLSMACAGPGYCHDGPPLRPNFNQFNNDVNLPTFADQPKPATFNRKPSTPKKPVQKAFRRGLNSYEYTAHYPRNAVLKARGYYDDDVDLGRLYARGSELDDRLRYRRDAEEYDLLDLEIRDLDEEYVTLMMNGNGLSSSSRAGGPHLPAGLDSSGNHMFFRLNTIPKTYPPFGSVDHAGLNKLMADLGGQHVDVVYGNPSKGYHECGLILVDMAWTKTHSNADGYPVTAQCRELFLGEMDEYTYIGQYSGGSVEKLSRALLSGRRYDHRSFHCGTFVEQLFRVLGFR